ncbi:hypothetical protein QQS45_13855 [Alteriqipengyuania flavescens]|uniref:hypothetical protein n=1 Tax=Alteriqipengyuania flavescens TaxID=3053610 RepID=UPI0025B4D9FF|nr:hypothetical protein [Alteriqipengyuania flavescens]WJY18666.1 hypothetical protein QQW98_13850 [Alteriqipengyuania flavescens]WJY24606.1 hypothetical protein QQS45_13855 [Alteriqipengyuania flavescens]
MNLETVLALVGRVGPIVAAAPEFRKLIEEIIATFTDERDQAELQLAYEHAISDAREAHEQLQTIIARNLK